ncbi:MAG: DUF3343 domain-containing protein [Corallococcus sp.]|nr:DUF3343 domain-containing protein [Corallococcus sp.]
MEYMIATYRSRNVTIKVYNYLTSQGINCALVSTPRAANVGCGLSVKFDGTYLHGLRAKLASVATFAGFFLVQNINGKTVVVRL